MVREVSFQEVPIGAELDPVEEVLTPELVQWYAHALDSPSGDW